MAAVSTWALGTANPLTDADHLAGVVTEVTPTDRKIMVQYRTWDQTLIEDVAGTIKVWSVRVDHLTAVQRAALLTLYRNTATVRFYDPVLAATYTVRFVSDVEQEIQFSQRHAITFTLESTGTTA